MRGDAVVSAIESATDKRRCKEAIPLEGSTIDLRAKDHRLSRAIGTEGLRERQVGHRRGGIVKEIDGIVDAHTTLIGWSKNELGCYLI